MISVEQLMAFYAALKLLVILILRKTKKDMTCNALHKKAVDAALELLVIVILRKTKT